MAQQTRPFIAINTDFIPAGKTNVAHARLNCGYFDSILNAGGIPVVIPPLNREVELNALLDRVDGVVLCGGLDLDPRRSGQPTHAAVTPMAERRQESDRLLVRRVIQQRLPVLGIAVGMQQLNAALGGQLYLHLPEDLPRALPHKDLTGGPHRHGVLIEPNTRLLEIYGEGELRVNSSHHQAVRQLGAGLRVAAKAPDGVIEAIEATAADWFCVGVQWHPESDTASALDLQLFESFIQACLRQAGSFSMAA